MKSLALITLTIVFMMNVQAQKDFDTYDTLHLALTKNNPKNISLQFRIMDKEAQLLNYEEVCQQMTHPQIAQQAGFEGMVQARVLVDETGTVSKYRVYGDYKELNKEVEKHLSALSFKPAVLNGEAVSSWESVRFKFRIRG